MADVKPTLQLRHQLCGQGIAIAAAAYDTRRHHLLTYDTSALRPHALRLFSLRREIRSVALFDDNNPPPPPPSHSVGMSMSMDGEDQSDRVRVSSVAVAATVVPLVSLIYSHALDVFICVYSAVVPSPPTPQSTHKPIDSGSKLSTGANAQSGLSRTQYVVLVLEPASLAQLARVPGPRSHALRCVCYDDTAMRLALACSVHAASSSTKTTASSPSSVMTVPSLPNAIPPDQCNAIDILLLAKRGFQSAGMHDDGDGRGNTASGPSTPRSLLCVERMEQPLWHGEALVCMATSRGMAVLYGSGCGRGWSRPIDEAIEGGSHDRDRDTGAIDDTIPDRPSAEHHGDMMPPVSESGATTGDCFILEWKQNSVGQLCLTRRIVHASDAITAMTVTASGNWLLTGHASGNLHVWGTVPTTAAVTSGTLATTFKLAAVGVDRHSHQQATSAVAAITVGRPITDGSVSDQTHPLDAEVMVFTTDHELGKVRHWRLCAVSPLSLEAASESIESSLIQFECVGILDVGPPPSLKKAPRKSRANNSQTEVLQAMPPTTIPICVAVDMGSFVDTLLLVMRQDMIHVIKVQAVLHVLHRVTGVDEIQMLRVVCKPNQSRGTIHSDGAIDNNRCSIERGNEDGIYSLICLCGEQQQRLLAATLGVQNEFGDATATAARFNVRLSNAANVFVRSPTPMKETRVTCVQCNDTVVVYGWSSGIVEIYHLDPLDTRIAVLRDANLCEEITTLLITFEQRDQHHARNSHPSNSEGAAADPSPQLTTWGGLLRSKTTADNSYVTSEAESGVTSSVLVPTSRANRALSHASRAILILAGTATGHIFGWKVVLPPSSEERSVTPLISCQTFTEASIRFKEPVHSAHIVALWGETSARVFSLGAEGMLKVWKFPQRQAIGHLNAASIGSASMSGMVSCFGVIGHRSEHEVGVNDKTRIVVIGYEDGSLGAWRMHQATTSMAVTFSIISISAQHERRVSAISGVPPTQVHGGAAACLEFVTGSFDAMVILWRVAEDHVQEIRYFDMGSPVIDCSVIAGGHAVAALPHEICSFALKASPIAQLPPHHAQRLRSLSSEDTASTDTSNNLSLQRVNECTNHAKQVQQGITGDVSSNDDHASVMADTAYLPDHRNTREEIVRCSEGSGEVSSSPVPLLALLGTSSEPAGNSSSNLTDDPSKHDPVSVINIPSAMLIDPASSFDPADAPSSTLDGWKTNGSHTPNTFTAETDKSQFVDGNVLRMYLQDCIDKQNSSDRILTLEAICDLLKRHCLMITPHPAEAIHRYLQDKSGHSSTSEQAFTVDEALHVLLAVQQRGIDETKVKAKAKANMQTKLHTHEGITARAVKKKREMVVTRKQHERTLTNRVPIVSYNLLGEKSITWVIKDARGEQGLRNNQSGVRVNTILTAGNEKVSVRGASSVSDSSFSGQHGSRAGTRKTGETPSSWHRQGNSLDTALLENLHLSSHFHGMWRNGYCWCEGSTLVLLWEEDAKLADSERAAENQHDVDDDGENGQWREGEPSKENHGPRPRSVPRCDRCARRRHTVTLTRHGYTPHFTVRMLLEVIEEVYTTLVAPSHALIYRNNDPSPPSSASTSGVSVHQVLFDIFQRRFGVPRVVESKIKLLIVSMCHAIRSVDAIAVFAEFLGLFVGNEANDGDESAHEHNDETPNEHIVALCVSVHAWLNSREMFVSGDALTGHFSSYGRIRSAAAATPTPTPTLPTTTATHWQFVRLANALACAQDLLAYPLVSPVFLHHVLAALHEFAQPTPTTPLGNHDDQRNANIDDCVSMPTSTFQSSPYVPDTQWLEVHRILRILVAEWKQQAYDFRSVERSLFAAPVSPNALLVAAVAGDTADQRRAVLEKLRLILSCCVFYDTDRIGVMHTEDFAGILRRLKYLWPNEQLSEQEAIALARHHRLRRHRQSHTHDDSLTFENAILAAGRRFVDTEGDGRLCYLDFWAMLYIIGVQTSTLLKFREIPSFCRDYKLELDDELRAALLTYMQFSSIIVLPRGFQLASSSMDESINHQHRRRVGGLHDEGVFQTGQTQINADSILSLATEELLRQHHDHKSKSKSEPRDANSRKLVDGLYVDGRVPPQYVSNNNTAALAKSYPMSSHAQDATKSDEDDVGGRDDTGKRQPRGCHRAQRMGAAPVVVGERANAHTHPVDYNPAAPLHVSLLGSVSDPSTPALVTDEPCTPARLATRPATDMDIPVSNPSVMTPSLATVYVQFPHVSPRRGRVALGIRDTGTIAPTVYHDGDDNDDDEAAAWTRQFLRAQQERDDGHEDDTKRAASRAMKEISATREKNRAVDTSNTHDGNTSSIGTSNASHHFDSGVVVIPMIEKMTGPKQEQHGDHSVHKQLGMMTVENMAKRRRQEQQEKMEMEQRAEESRESACVGTEVGDLVDTRDDPSQHESESQSQRDVSGGKGEQEEESILPDTDDEKDKVDAGLACVASDGAQCDAPAVVPHVVLQASSASTRSDEMAATWTDDIESLEENEDKQSSSQDAVVIQPPNGDDDGSHKHPRSEVNSDEGENEIGEDDNDESNDDEGEEANVSTGGEDEEGENEGEGGEEEDQHVAMETEECQEAEENGDDRGIISSEESRDPNDTDNADDSTMEQDITGAENTGAGDTIPNSLTACVEDVAADTGTDQVELDADETEGSTPTENKEESCPAPSNHDDRKANSINQQAELRKIQAARFTPSRECGAIRHRFKFSRQPVFQTTAAISTNLQRLRQWTPFDDEEEEETDGDHDGVGDSVDGPMSALSARDDSSVYGGDDVNHGVQNTVTTQRTTLNADDEEARDVVHLEILPIGNKSESNQFGAARRSSRVSTRALGRVSMAITELHSRTQIVDGTLVSSNATRPPRTIRLDESAERALYGERVVNHLGEGVVLSQEAEEARQQRWQSMFTTTERAMFQPLREMVASRDARQRAEEELQNTLRQRRQEQEARNHAARLARQTQVGASTNASPVVVVAAASPMNHANFRSRRATREQCLQVQHELPYGDARGGELAYSGQAAYYHFQYAREAHGTILTIKLHVAQGNAEMFMSTATKAPCESDWMWRSQERSSEQGLDRRGSSAVRCAGTDRSSGAGRRRRDAPSGQGDAGALDGDESTGNETPAEGQKIVLFPVDLAQVVASRAADDDAQALVNDDTNTILPRSSSITAFITFYVAVIALEPHTVFSVGVMASGQKVPPSRALETVDTLIADFHNLARSIEGKARSVSMRVPTMALSRRNSSRLAASDSACDAQSDEPTGSGRRPRLRRRHRHRKEVDAADVTARGDVVQTSGREEGDANVDDGQDHESCSSESDEPDDRRRASVDASDSHSFQQLLESLSSRHGVGPPTSNSFVLQYGSAAERDFLQDEETRLEHTIQRLSPTKMDNGSPVLSEQSEPATSTSVQWATERQLSHASRRRIARLKRRLSPLKSKSQVKPAVGSVNDSISLRVARFEPKRAAYSLSSLPPTRQGLQATSQSQSQPQLRTLKR